MIQAGFIFLSGIVGVFFGMALLYLSIRVTSFISMRLENKNNKAK